MTDTIETKPHPTTKEEAYSAIYRYTDEAYQAIKKAEALADEFKLEFGFDLAYGMGGTYNGDPDERRYSEEGWISSTQQCM